MQVKCGVMTYNTRVFNIDKGFSYFALTVRRKGDLKLEIYDKNLR